jgi:hypothetical protein
VHDPVCVDVLHTGGDVEQRAVQRPHVNVGMNRVVAAEPAALDCGGRDSYIRRVLQAILSNESNKDQGKGVS